MQQLDAKEVYQQLGAPFSDDEIEWRCQQVFEGSNGKGPAALVIPYIRSRAIMNRLDQVFGWERWENLVQELPGGGILQGIRVWLSDTHSVTKWDGADRTNIESTKGGISSAFKRAAVQFNIGRYLYNEKPKWVEIKSNKTGPDDEYVQDKKKEIYGYFTPPSLSTSSENHKAQGRNTKVEERNNSQNHEQSLSERQNDIGVPPGMLECTFKGVIDKEGSSGPYLEVWLESNGELAQLYAIGEIRNTILAQDLSENEKIAIASTQNQAGYFVIDNIVKVA